MVQFEMWRYYESGKLWVKLVALRALLYEQPACESKLGIAYQREGNLETTPTRTLYPKAAPLI